MEIIPSWIKSTNSIRKSRKDELDAQFDELNLVARKLHAEWTKNSPEKYFKNNVDITIQKH